ncbi:hypothetical protein KUTeg_022810 [Tegillarca granosa]|uniref:Uncharacterized protein n=1 Tax=Tegillarca granosa TaxID=220873 RepID=A0ABQ9E5L4_TEGGR|nr:hypothetical protein KUTeg_022810 [Tegillarca granosa]
MLYVFALDNNLDCFIRVKQEISSCLFFLIHITVNKAKIRQFNSEFINNANQCTYYHFYVQNSLSKKFSSKCFIIIVSLFVHFDKR